jgi:hypothetical protein
MIDNGQMTSAKLRATVDALRAANERSTDFFLPMLGGTIDEQTAAAAETDGAPREFLDFCRVLDGASCNPSLQLFGLKEAMEHQFYCTPVVDSPLDLSPAKLFCIGMNDITPIYLDRASGSVLGIPDEHWEWVDAEHFDELAPTLEEFFLERLASPRYVQFAKIDDALLDYDDWLKLLRRASLAG